MARTKSKVSEAPGTENSGEHTETSSTGASPAAPALVPAAAVSKTKTVKARVLAACSFGQPNNVIEIDVELAKSLAGVVDTDPEAVAYAESIQGA